MTPPAGDGPRPLQSSLVCRPVTTGHKQSSRIDRIKSARNRRHVTCGCTVERVSDDFLTSSLQCVGDPPPFKFRSEFTWQMLVYQLGQSWEHKQRCWSLQRSRPPALPALSSKVVFSFNKVFGANIYIEDRFYLYWTFIGGSRGGLRGLKPALNFFRYVVCLMVPDTETPIGVLFCIAFKSTFSCTGIGTKILNAKLILLNLDRLNVFISL